MDSEPMTCIQPLPVVEAESLRVPVHVRALQDESTDLNHRDQRVHALDCHGALTFHWQLQKKFSPANLALRAPDRDRDSESRAILGVHWPSLIMPALRQRRAQA